jgi:hypothetical protein
LNPALSPEEMIALGTALDLLVEKYGPLAEADKAEIAEMLLQLGQEGEWDVNRLVEVVTSANKHK